MTMGNKLIDSVKYFKIGDTQIKTFRDKDPAWAHKTVPEVAHYYCRTYNS